MVLLLHLNTQAQAVIGSKDWAKRGGTWAPSAGGDDNLSDMVTDRWGNIYVLAESYGKVNIDGHIAAPDSNAKRTLSSWDCYGNFRWMKVYYGDSGAGVYSQLGIDSNGNVYLGGIFSIPQPGAIFHLDADTAFMGVISNRHFIIKYDSAGAMQWLKTPINNWTEGIWMNMSVTEGGDIYNYVHLASGAHEGGAYALNTNSYCVVKYNTSGTFQAITLLDMKSVLNSSAQYSYFSHFTRDHGTGRYYVTGSNLDFSADSLTIGTTPILTSVSTTQTKYRLFAAAFSAGGNSLWVKTGDTGRNGELYTPVFDEDGNVYMSGYSDTGNVFDGNIPLDFSFIISLDSNGNKLWLQKPANHAGGAFAPLVYRNGVILFVGGYTTALQWGNFSFQGGSFSQKGFVGAMNAGSGNVLQLDSIAGGKWARTYSYMLAADDNGNIFVGGELGDSLYFGNDVLAKIDTSYADNDWYAAKFKVTECNCQVLSPQFSYSVTAASGVVSFAYNGQVPYTTITWDFGDGTILTGTSNPTHTYTLSGNFAVCVTVTNSCGNNTICHHVTVERSTTVLDNVYKSDGIEIYPNPASDKLTLSGVTGSSIASVYDIQGRFIESFFIKNNKTELNIADYTSGIYLLRITDKNGMQMNARFVKE